MMILSLMLASLMNVFVVESPSYAKEMVAASRRWTADELEGRSLRAGGQDRHPRATAKTTLAHGF